MKTSARSRTKIGFSSRSSPPDTPPPPTRSSVDAVEVPRFAGGSSDLSAAPALPNGVLPIEQILAALKALKRGDFDVRIAGAWTGLSGEVAETYNEVAEIMARSTEELTRVSRVVGKEGKLQERLSFGHATAGWAERINSTNALIHWLVQPS